LITFDRISNTLCGGILKQLGNMGRIISKLAVASVWAIFGVGASLLQNSRADNAAKTNEIRATTDRYHNSLVAGDDEVLRSILGEELRITTMFENSLVSQNDYISRLHSLDGKLESVEINDVRIKVDGRVAVVECSVKMSFVSRWSNVVPHEAAYTFGFEMIDSKWRITSIQQQLH